MKILSVWTLIKSLYFYYHKKIKKFLKDQGTFQIKKKEIKNNKKLHKSLGQAQTILNLHSPRY